MKHFLVLSMVLWAQALYCQNFTISGFLSDSLSGEKVLYGAIGIGELNTGTSTNEYGYYSISVPKGSYHILVNLPGFEVKRQLVKVDQNVKLNIDLKQQAESLDVVEIKTNSKETDQNLKKAEAGVIELDVQELNKVPVIMGEKDVIKTLSLMPGVSLAGEGSTGLYVRGGGIDQNLLLLDEAPVYNPSHVLGFLSVFNSDALKDMKVYKAGAPARYGGRSSSVIDIRMKEGNNKSFHGKGGIGLIASRLSLEGPIKKDKGSFIISGRRSYLDLFTRLSPDPLIRQTRLYFYDLNFKANYTINQRNKLFVSGYLGNDAFGFKDEYDPGFTTKQKILWGNKTSTIRWNHLFSNKLFSNTTLIFSDFKFGASFEDKYDDFVSELDYSNGIRNYSLKQDFTYYLNNNNKLRFGTEINNQIFSPGVYKYVENNVVEQSNTEQKQGLEASVYLLNEQKINDRLNLNYGLRVSSMNLYGPSNHYDFDDNGSIIDSTRYRKGVFFKSFFGLEPRFNSSYRLNKVSSIKASYARMMQYLHQVSHISSGTPLDYWLPVSNFLKPGISDQVSLGYHRNFAKNKYEFSVETYYKEMQNVVDYKDGAFTFAADSIEGELTIGRGRAYGAEVFLKKRTGKFTGWISYSLMRSERKFDDINKGQWYLARQSRTHDISAVEIYEITKKHRISLSWVYNTGDAVTFPSGSYQIDGITYRLYSERNASRMPAYHRLDVSFDYQVKKTEKFESSWNFSVYNVYNQMNAYAINFRNDYYNPGEIKAYKLTLLPIIPSVTYNFKF